MREKRSLFSHLQRQKICNKLAVYEVREPRCAAAAAPHKGPFRAARGVVAGASLGRMAGLAREASLTLAGALGKPVKGNMAPASLGPRRLQEERARPVEWLLPAPSPPPASSLDAGLPSPMPGAVHNLLYGLAPGSGANVPTTGTFDGFPAGCNLRTQDMVLHIACDFSLMYL